MALPLITVIGSLNTDLITCTSRVPAAGETLISQSFDTGSGGKGANQAVACARLSRNRGDDAGKVTVRMIGAVGDDTFGVDLVNGMDKDDIDTSGIQVKPDEKTGVAVIIVESETGENRILMSPNANFSLRPSDFTKLPMPVPDLIVLQLEIPLDTTLQILKSAGELGINVLLNPAPARKLPDEAYAYVNHLIVNESEAAIITKSKDKVPDWTRPGDHFNAIVALGVKHVIITLGARGVIYLETKQQKLWHFDAENVVVVDTTAAGDTFVGAYAVAVTTFAKGAGDFAPAVKWANAAAAKTVGSSGAQAAIPWCDDIAAFEPEVKQEPVSFDAWR